jgi:hypothetical protein
MTWVSRTHVGVQNPREGIRNEVGVQEAVRNEVGVQKAEETGGRTEILFAQRGRVKPGTTTLLLRSFLHVCNQQRLHQTKSIA